MQRDQAPWWIVVWALLPLAGCPEQSTPDGGGVGGGGNPSGGGSGGGGSPPVAIPDGEIDLDMRDATKLRTWVYMPTGDGPFPMFVVRNPYLALNDEADLRAYAAFFQERGIGLVWQAVRGTGGSGGEFIPYVSELEDAADTLAWLAAQPWSNGRFAAGGGSYLGYTAWAAAAADPRVVVVLSDDTAADEEMTRHGGVVDGYVLSWWSYVERQRFADEGEQSALTNGLDVPNADSAVLGRDAPYWNELLEAGLTIFPPEASLRVLAQNICTPALHVIEGGTGWRDPVETWDAILKDGCAAERAHQWLIVAPESHAYHFSAFGLADTWVTEDMMTMLEAFLLETAPAPSWPRVRYRADPADQTHELGVWPPTDSTPIQLFLGAASPGADGPLTTAPPPSDTWTLLSDPEGTDPCVLPTGVWFTSEPLTADLRVVGEPRLSLTVTTDAADFDLFVTLYDYVSGQEAYSIIGTGSVRARHRQSPEAPVPSGVPFALAIDLTGSAHHVPAGHRLTLNIAPSQCGSVENPNTAEPLGAQLTRQLATLDVELGPSGATLTLPTR